MIDILVESSTGTRTRVTVLSDVTQTSAEQWLKTRKVLLGCFKAIRYTVMLFFKFHFMYVSYLLSDSTFPCFNLRSVPSQIHEYILKHYSFVKFDTCFTVYCYVIVYYFSDCGILF